MVDGGDRFVSVPGEHAKRKFIVSFCDKHIGHLQNASAGILDIHAIAPEITVLSGNRNRGNGITKNQVGGNQETNERLETYEGPAGLAAASAGAGAGGLLGGFV